MICRYGGEEFAIIMPGIEKDDALHIIERLRASIEKTFKRPQKKGPLPPLTISTGIASFPDDSIRKESLIKKADNALYLAKKQGKNKTVFSS